MSFYQEHFEKYGSRIRQIIEHDYAAPPCSFLCFCVAMWLGTISEHIISEQNIIASQTITTTSHTALNVSHGIEKPW